MKRKAKGKSAAKTKLPATVDAYIAAQPLAVQSILKRVRATVRRAAPRAQELISYRMPALRQRGILVYYAAFKNHIGLYPPVRGDDAAVKEASAYAGEKGNLRFPLDEPIPYALIGRLTRLRAKQDREK
jgi:uncharacterized protein YdhG (YjbR/CyaY superfamily)